MKLEDEQERTSSFVVIDDPDSTKKAVIEIKRQRLFKSDSVVSSLWSLIPEFVGMTRTVRSKRKRVSVDLAIESSFKKDTRSGRVSKPNKKRTEAVNVQRS